MDIVVKSVQRRLPKGSHKGRQAGHHNQTGKYSKQRTRTTINKRKAQDKHLAKHPNDLQATINISKSREV